MKRQMFAFDIFNALLNFARDVRCFAFCVQFLDLCKVLKMCESS